MSQSIKTGLSDDEIQSSRLKYGSNRFETKSENQTWILIKEIVGEPLFVILVCASVIYFVLGEYKEGIIMLVALSFVSGISLYQENKSRKAVDALKKLSNPRAKVIRNGTTQEIATEELVIGDVICVEDGNIIPVDALVLEAHDFSVNESVVNGESMPVDKDAAEPNNILYGGTMVSTGSCIAKVNAIGAQTVLGKIDSSLNEIKTSKTPLQLQIKHFVKSLVGVGVIAFLVVWGINYYLSKSILHGLLHGLTLAMSVLPEEIPVAFSTFMALGAYHLYKQKVIALSPHTVETLGAATVICTDKTGTLTENEMRLSAIYDFTKNCTYDYTNKNIEANIVLEYAMWSSESDPFDNMEKSIHAAYGQSAGEDKRPGFSMIHEYPLGGKPPMMTHVFSDQKKEHLIAVKGSVEAVMNHSVLSESQKQTIKDQSKIFTSKGYRVLGVGRSLQDVKNLPKTQEELSFDFLGLLAFYDPPKKNMADILKRFYEAGIRVIMITGDQAETASAIAEQIHFKNSSEVLTGKEISEMDMATLQEKVNHTTIYARMFPDAKLKVIEALKANGEVVAMTGDGVNDGPALKAAHIGVAMGLRGSELAKRSASLILMDDDLVHMVEAIALGRRIYENLKKAILYIISIHIPIILIVTLPLLLFWKFTDIFSPIHVIFLELIMGPTCSIVFEKEPIEKNSMQKAPRKMSVTFFSIKELFLSIVQGLVITIGCLGLGYYFMKEGYDEKYIRTVIYSTLIFSNLFLTLVNRSFVYSVITTLRYPNKLLPIVLILSLVVLALSLYLPAVRAIFEFTALDGVAVLWSLITAFVAVMWVEIYKALKPTSKIPV